MNYTDRFFEFPVRIYDGFELRKAIEIEEKAFEDNVEQAAPVESDWIEGIASVLPVNILGYSDTFSKSRNVDDVLSKGFDLLLVETSTQGDMICTWSREKFKKKLNEFMENYEKLKRDESNNNPLFGGITYTNGYPDRTTSSSKSED